MRSHVRVCLAARCELRVIHVVPHGAQVADRAAGNVDGGDAGLVGRGGCRIGVAIEENRAAVG